MSWLVDTFFLGASHNHAGSLYPSEVNHPCLAPFSLEVHLIPLALTFIAPYCIFYHISALNWLYLIYLILPTRLCRVWSSGPSCLYCCYATPPSPIHTSGLVKAVNPVSSGVPLLYHGVARMHPFFKPQGGHSWMWHEVSAFSYIGMKCRSGGQKGTACSPAWSIKFMALGRWTIP